MSIDKLEVYINKRLDKGESLQEIKSDLTFLGFAHTKIVEAIGIIALKREKSKTKSILKKPKKRAAAKKTPTTVKKTTKKVAPKKTVKRAKPAAKRPAQKRKTNSATKRRIEEYINEHMKMKETVQQIIKDLEALGFTTKDIHEVLGMLAIDKEGRKIR